MRRVTTVSSKQQKQKTNSMITKESIAAPTEATTLPPNIPINRDRASFRIKEATFGQSKSSGNNMITIDTEIFDPVEIKSAVNGNIYTVAGLSTKLYFSKTDKTGGDYYCASIGMGMIGRQGQVGFMEILGLAPTLDGENPNTEQFTNKVFAATMNSDKKQQYKDLTQEDIAAGKKVGEPLLDEDNNPIISYGLRISGPVQKTKKVAPGF